MKNTFTFLSRFVFLTNEIFSYRNLESPRIRINDKYFKIISVHLNKQKYFNHLIKSINERNMSLKLKTNL